LTGRIFSDVTVFGVEPAVVRWGEVLSDPVRAALDRVVDGILEEVDARKRKARSAAPATATAVRIGPNERNGTKTE